MPPASIGLAEFLHDLGHQITLCKPLQLNEHEKHSLAHLALPSRGAMETNYIFTMDLEVGHRFGYCAFFVSRRSTRRLWRQRSVFILSTSLQPHFYLPICIYAAQALQNNITKQPEALLDDILSSLSVPPLHTRVLRAFSCTINDMISNLTLVYHPPYAGCVLFNDDAEYMIDAPARRLSDASKNGSNQSPQLSVQGSGDDRHPRRSSLIAASEGNESFYSAEEREECPSESDDPPQIDTENSSSNRSNIKSRPATSHQLMRLTSLNCDESALRNQLVVTDGLFINYLPTLMTSMIFRMELLPVVSVLWEQVVRDKRILVYGSDPHRVSMTVLSLLAIISPLVRSIGHEYSPILIPMTDAPFIVKILKGKLQPKRAVVGAPVSNSGVGDSSPMSEKSSSANIAVDLQGAIESCPPSSYILGTTNPNVVHQLEHDGDMLDCVVLINCVWDKIHLPSSILNASNVRLVSASKFSKSPSTWIKSTMANNGSYLYCNVDPNIGAGNGLLGLSQSGGGGGVGNCSVGGIGSSSSAGSSLISGVWSRESSALSVDQHKGITGQVREVLNYCQKLSASGTGIDPKTQTLGQETLAVRHEEKLRTLLRELTNSFLEPVGDLCFQNQGSLFKQLKLNPFTRLTLANAILTKIHGDIPELIKRISDYPLTFRDAKKQRLLPLYKDFIQSSMFRIWLRTVAQRKLCSMRTRQWDLITSCTGAMDLKQFAAIELQNGLEYVESFSNHVEVGRRIQEELSRRGKRNFLD